MPFWYGSTIASTITTAGVNPCSVGINAETPIPAPTTFPTGITIGSGSNATTLSPEGSQNTTIASGSLWVGDSNTHLDLLDNGIEFYTTAEGQIPFVTTSGSNVLLDGISEINGLAVLGVAGSNTQFVQYGAQTADAAGVTITLPTAYKDVGYSVFLTQTDVAPTIVPWGKILTPSTFVITGDTGENVCWMTIGAPA